MFPAFCELLSSCQFTHLVGVAVAGFVQFWGGGNSWEGESFAIPAGILTV